MKRRFTYSLISLLLIGHLISFNGCVSVQQTIYLGDVDVNAPILPPPTHINVNKGVGNITISPKFSIIKNNAEIIGSTSDHYIGAFNLGNDTTYRAKNKNLLWNISNYTIGADLDYKAFKAFSLFGGINYSGDGQKMLMGGNIGIGLHNDAENPVIRLDLGVTIQEYDFTAITIVNTKTISVFGSDEYWYIFADKGSITNVNPFATLTINSTYDSSFFNWFVTGGYFTQNLLGYTPGTYSYPLFPFAENYIIIDKRSDMLAGFLYFNPGITLNLNSEIKLVMSAKILNEVSATSSTEWFIMPSAQIDFQF
jgi:hypothetical protein